MIYIKEIFEKINATLKDSGDLPVSTWFDWDKGQLLNRKKPPVDFPAVLLSITTGLNTQLGRGKQIVEVKGKMQIAFKQIAKANSSVSEEQRSASLDHLSILQNIYYLVHHNHTASCNPFICSNITQQTINGMNVYYFNFDTTAFVSMPNNRTVVAKPTPIITAEKTKDK